VKSIFIAQCALIVLLLCSCAHQQDSQTEQQTRIAALTLELQKIAPDADQKEARHFASIAVRTTADLREQYQVSAAPWVHNIEVNSGIKPRGLCFHYANDLAVKLQPLTRPHWQLHFVQAKPKELLEHNAIVITGVGKPWQSGIVLDGWRDSGVLYFGPVMEDKYPWQLKNSLKNKNRQKPDITTSDHPEF
jgi:hypothetical protein